MFDLAVVFGDGGVDLLDAEPDAEGLLLQCVLLLLQHLYLLQHPLILLLNLRQGGLEDEKKLSLSQCSLETHLDVLYTATAKNTLQWLKDIVLPNKTTITKPRNGRNDQLSPCTHTLL